MKLTRKTFLCTEVQLKMMELLKEKVGIKTETGVFDMALSNLYRNIFKYGEDPLNKVSPGDTTETIISKAKARVLTKQAIKDAELEARLVPKIDMCVNLLGGQVEENENGHKFCRYTTYSLNGDYEQKLPILQVDPVIAETSLFTPTKELIFEERPDIAKKFNKLSFYK